MTDDNLDTDALERLANDVGADALPMLLGAFAEELSDQQSEVLDAEERQDAAVVARHGHTLKSSAATFGAYGLSACGAQINDAWHAGNTARVLELAQPLISQIKAASEALDNYLKSNGMNSNGVTP